MSGLDVSSLPTDTPNAILLDAVRNAASSDYQLRIPSADKAGVAATIASLMDPNARRWRNEFIDALVNRIGATIARSNSWSNPFAMFKRGLLEYGNTIEEIQTGLLKAHNWDPDRDYLEGTLFSRERPEVQANFHTVNRQDFYKVTVNENMLKRAFLEPTGIAGFINQLMDAPTTSDNWDEFLLMTSLFAEYEANGGFYHVNVPNVSDIESDAADAKIAIRKMRAVADNMKFLSSKYNAAKMPTFANAEDLCIFTTPEFNAAIDVEALAAAFNIDRSQLHGRVMPIPSNQFNIDGCQAIMTTKDFFVVADALFESTSQWNPASLSNNYFLHHHEIVSASRFVPAVMFTTNQDDEVIQVYTPATSVSAITFLPAPDGTTPTSVAHGGVAAFTASVSPAGADQGLDWTISGSVALSSGTFITKSGVLHIGLDEKNTSITVKATTTTINPTDTYGADQTATLSVPISDAALAIWPNVGAITNITVQDHPVTAFAVGTLTYNINVPAHDEDGDTTVIEPDDIVVHSAGFVDVQVSLAGPNGSAPQYVATVNTQTSPAATPVVYTVNITLV